MTMTGVARVHTEYPRPQLERASYLNLNGVWDFARGAKGEKPEYREKIVVPFSPETRASGIGDFVLQPDGEIHYRTSFVLPDGFVRDRVLLHFGAVDYACVCRVNGREAGTHRGGFFPFFFDITALLSGGENVLELDVTDPTDTGTQARGKQKLERGGIWYTPQSGIWQTVWIESVPTDYVRDISIKPDIDSETVTINVDSTGSAVRVRVYDGTELVGESDSARAVISMKGRALWSPESPKLYDIVVTTTEDEVRSYFGMRKFSIGFDGQYRRLFLNNKPYFHKGLLDQGYWADGLLTPPDDAAMVRELELVKRMGFNMLRKHIKVEPLRWYYHCDRLGLLVWQDLVCGGGPYKFMKVAALPFLGFRFSDRNYRFMGRTDSAGREEFERDMRDTVAALRNSVSLAMWVPFNEGWGQFDSVRISAELARLDPTRTIDSVSGWHDQGPRSSAIKSLHTYYTKLKVPAREKRVVVLSEFGGYSLPVAGHVFDEKKLFGYKIFQDRESLAAAYRTLVEESLLPLIARGLSASVYTQLSDVEEEINGLVTFDRAVVKFDEAFVRELNDRLVIPDANT
jgi:beta-galactosidase/beta-glucuronidase